MQEQMGNVCGEMKTLRKIQKQILEVRNCNKNEKCL